MGSVDDFMIGYHQCPRLVLELVQLLWTYFLLSSIASGETWESQSSDDSQSEQEESGMSEELSQSENEGNEQKPKR